MSLTLNDLLRNSAESLQAAGYVHAQREAEIILGHLTGLDTAKLFTQGEDLVDQGTAEKVDRAVAQRTQGKPIAYIVGSQSFLGWQFKTDERALIPRPETEQLVEFLVKKIRDKKFESGSALEIGTGSGAISIALKKHFPLMNILATDVSADALELAEDNANSLGVEIDLKESDLFENLKRGKYDVVVANLPYVPTEKLTFVSDEILDWEPMVAIEAGEDGYLYISKLLEQVSHYLQPDGVLALEMWHTHAPLIEESVNNFLKGYKVTIEQDLAGYDRFAFIEKLD